ncbi:MAG: hypothetical protein H0W88_09885 [Parachlamydiaceae bacterium]|nr:hypothetical protein [Parachlamydiaceae bacterium]
MIPKIIGQNNNFDIRSISGWNALSETSKLILQIATVLFSSLAFSYFIHKKIKDWNVKKLEEKVKGQHPYPAVRTNSERQDRKKNANEENAERNEKVSQNALTSSSTSNGNEEEVVRSASHDNKEVSFDADRPEDTSKALVVFGERVQKLGNAPKKEENSKELVLFGSQQLQVQQMHLQIHPEKLLNDTIFLDPLMLIKCHNSSIRLKVIKYFVNDIHLLKINDFETVKVLDVPPSIDGGDKSKSEPADPSKLETQPTPLPKTPFSSIDDPEKTLNDPTEKLAKAVVPVYQVTAEKAPIYQSQIGNTGKFQMEKNAEDKTSVNLQINSLILAEKSTKKDVDSELLTELIQTAKKYFPVAGNSEKREYRRQKLIEILETVRKKVLKIQDTEVFLTRILSGVSLTEIEKFYLLLLEKCMSSPNFDQNVGDVILFNFFHTYVGEEFEAEFRFILQVFNRQKIPLIKQKKAHSHNLHSNLPVQNKSILKAVNYFKPKIKPKNFNEVILPLPKNIKLFTI